MQTSPQPTPEASTIPAETNEPWHAPLNRVTTVSKILAAVVFITLPFMGFWLGMGIERAEESVVSVSPVSLPADNVTEGEEAVSVVSKKNGNQEQGQSLSQRQIDLFNVIATAAATNQLPGPTFEQTRKVDFVYKEKPGVVYEFCVAGETWQEVGTVMKHKFCSGVKAIVMQYDQKTVVLSTSTFSGLSEYRELGEKFMTDESGTLVGENAGRLILDMSHLPCAGVPLSDMCEEYTNSDLLVVDMEKMMSQTVVTENQSPSIAFSNAKGTKVILVNIDKLGGQFSLQGLDVVSGKLTVLSKKLETKRVPVAEDVSWVSEGVVAVFDKEYSF